MEVPNQHVESTEVVNLPPQQSETLYDNQGTNVAVNVLIQSQVNELACQVFSSFLVVGFWKSNLST